MAVHTYIPFGGIADVTKQGILDRLNEPNAQFNFTEPQIIIAPPIDTPSSSTDNSTPMAVTTAAYPDHSQVKLADAVRKELAHGKQTGTNAALFVWAEGSALQPSDPTVRIIYVEAPPSDNVEPVVEELRVEIGEAAAVLNCVESGVQSFGECQDWAGADGVVRREKEVQQVVKCEKGVQHTAADA